MRFRRFARNVALIAGLGHGKGIPIEKQKNLAPVKTPIKPKGKDVGKQFEVAVRGNAEPPHLVKRYAPENEFMKKEYPTAKF